MRVLLITNDYPPRPGGIQQYLGNIVRHLDEPVRVLAPADPGAGFEEHVVRGDRRFMWPNRPVRRWVEHEVDRFAPDVIVFGAPHPLAHLGPGLRRSTGIPYVVMAHGAEVTVPAAFPGVRQLVAGPLRQADVVFGVSRFTVRRVEALTRRAVTYLGAGVDVETFHPATAPRPDRFVVGTVGRFTPRKGHDRVLRAAARVHRRRGGVEVLVVGKGRLEGRLRRLAERLDVPCRFEVGVPWERLPDLYRSMDVFVAPTHSRWGGLEVEGLGIVYFEAAATGLPVVAGTSGGSPETVVPGVTGYVTASVAGVSEAIEWVLDHPEEARAMGTAGRRRVEESATWRVVIDRFRAAVAPAL